MKSLTSLLIKNGRGCRPFPQKCYHTAYLQFNAYITNTQQKRRRVRGRLSRPHMSPKQLQRTFSFLLFLLILYIYSGVYIIYFVDEINKTNRFGFPTCWSRSTDRQYALRTRTPRPCHVCLSFSYLGSTFPLVSYAHGMGGGGALLSPGYFQLLNSIAGFGYVVVAPRACNLGCAEDRLSLPRKK